MAVVRAAGSVDVARAAAVVKDAGAWLALVPLPTLVAMALDAEGWRRILIALGQRRAWRALLALRLGVESVVLALPGGAVAGEAMKLTLLGRRLAIPLPLGAASLTVTKTLLTAAAAVYLGAATLTFALGPAGHAYDRFCVASEGYRQLFVKKGVRPQRLVVTGIPNFDNCERYRDNDFPHRGFVLVCSSDIRETARWEDRPAFIADVVRIAAGRLIVWKLHPNENAARARAEIARAAPAALVYDAGSAEEMIANCDVLVTQYSSTAYVGLALGKEVHSYFDVEELRRLCPIQNGSTSARRIADVCRQLLCLPPAAAAQTSGADRLLPEHDLAVLAGHERDAPVLRDHDG